MTGTLNKTQNLLFAGDLFFCLAATKMGQWLRFGRYYDIFDAETGGSLFSICIYLFMFYVFDLDNVYNQRNRRDILKRMTLAMLFAGGLIMILFYSLPLWQFGRGVFLIQYCFVFLFCFTWRLYFHFIKSSSEDKDNVLILGTGENARHLYHLLNSPSYNYNVVGFLSEDNEIRGVGTGMPPVFGSTVRLKEIISHQDVRIIVWTMPHCQPTQITRDALNARMNGVELVEYSEIYEELTGSVPVGHLEDDWFVFASGFNLISKRYLQRIKRFFDFWMSLALLIFTSPIFLITALAIKLESHGALFYRQKRVGMNGREFNILKFRSMRESVEKNGAVWAVENDPRVTRVGRFIRMLRIDELPQLINVLKREMSLIGPRPERPEFTQELEEKIPYYSIRHYVRPGLTGWAQVSFTYGASIEDSKRKLEYDLYYIKNMSIWLDIKILIKTIGVVLSGQGAR